MRTKPLRWVIGSMAAWILSLLGACVMPPPESAPPHLSAVRSSMLVSAPVGGWPSQTWWQSWKNPDLNRLVAAAEANNPDMDAALARLQQASAAVGLYRSALGPQVSAAASVDHELLSANSYIPPPYGGKVYDDGELGVQAQWDLDIWGQRRAQWKAALGERKARGLELQGMADWLSTQVAASYVRYEYLLLQQGLLKKQQAIEKAILRRQQLRVQQGLVPAENIQEPLLRQMATRQQGVDVTGALVLERVQLQALTQLPLAQLNLPGRDMPNLVYGIPPQLPLDLVARRADLAAAKARVEAALLSVHAAHQAFYPDINLSAMLGYSSLGLSQLVDAGSRTAGITPALHLPLFDAGRLKIGMQLQQSAAVLAVADYHTVLTHAVTEVNQALTGLHSVDQQRQVLQRRIQEAQLRAQDLRLRVHAGLEDSLRLLVLQRELNALDLLQLGLDRQALLDRVLLVQALGGGFSENSAVAQVSSLEKKLRHD